MDLSVTRLPLDQILTHESHPDPTPWLLESMAECGQFQLIKVTAREDGTYEIRAGRRRVKAARQLGWTTIEAYVVPAGESPYPTELEAIIANTRCENLEQLHMAMRVRQLVREEGYTQSSLARKIRVSQPNLSQMVQVVECEALVQAVKEDGLAFSAAKVLVPLPPAARRELLVELRRQAAANGKFPSVRQVEELVRRRPGAGARAAQFPPLDLRPEDLRSVIEELQAPGVPIVVQVVRGKKSRVTVDLHLTAALEGCLRERLAADRAAASPLPAAERSERSGGAYLTCDTLRRPPLA